MPKLAINGGRRQISRTLLKAIPAWPITHENVPELLTKIYLSRKWSFNSLYEQKFSKAFARHHSSQYGIFMTNGTVTLQCALKALGIKEGDEVIVPALTWIATAMSAVYLGAKPVFVDIEPDTLCIDSEKIKKAITSKTKAIIPVHIYGSMADMEAITDIKDKYGISIVEDCAHAHGGRWAGKGLGSIGDVGSFSFQQSKTLTSGEGGICITNDNELAERIFRLKHIGYDLRSKQGQAQSASPEGLICHNFRATEFQAAILLEHLKYLKKETKLRDKNANILRKLLADVDGVKVQARGRLADLQGYYALTLLVDLKKFNNISLDRLKEILHAEGLPINKTYGPVYKHNLWSVPKNYYKMTNCEICENVCNNIALCLGQSWLLTDEKIMKAIANTFKKVLSARKELV